MNVIGETVGSLCNAFFPIREKSYLGNPLSSIAVCTLSSMKLLKKFKNSEALEHIFIVGRLFSENKGIDSILNFVSANPKISTIIVCGTDTWGHRPGHSLFKLHKNGIDENSRIVYSSSPEPILSVSKSQVEYFQKKITLENMIGETDYDTILEKIKNC